MRDAGRRLAGGHRGWNTGATAVATACRWTIAVFAITAMALSGRAISLPQRAYVWQRAWTSVVRSEVAAHAGTFAAVDVLNTVGTTVIQKPGSRKVVKSAEFSNSAPGWTAARCW